MTRIALVAVNAKYSHTNLALLYLEAALRAGKIIFELIEWDINRPGVELLEIIAGGNYSHAVFSVYIWNSLFINDLLADLSQFSRRPVVCAGGPEVTHNSGKWIGVRGLDYILDGPAEDFAGDLPELQITENTVILKKKANAFTKTLFPYDKDLLSKLTGRLIYYEASRGCRFSCSYCLSACGGNSVDYRSTDQISEEIKLLGTFQGTVKFVDRTFNSNTEVSRLIWRHMTKNSPAGCFHFEIHPLLLEREDIDLLKALPPGSAQLEIGIQSTDLSVLKNVNRPGNWKMEKAVIEELIDSGLFHIHLDQIVGLPGDSPESAMLSLNEIMSTGPDNFQLGFLKILPGTPLSLEMGKWGIKASASPPYEILESSLFSFPDLRHFHRIEKLINILYNSGFFKKTLVKLSTITGSWTELIGHILDIENTDLNCRRWEYWGEKILNLIKFRYPKHLPLLTDLLRLDWCPYAGAQYYPDFINYKDISMISSMRKAALERIRREQPQIGKSALNRAILFVPEHPELSETVTTFFFKYDGIKKKTEMP